MLFRSALVQPSVPQTLQWDPDEQGRTFTKIEGLSRQAMALEPAVLVWPEGTFGLSETNYARMIALIGKDGPDWILGADDAVAREGEGAAGARPGLARYNAAFLRRGDGSMPPAYWKRRLVPFGEYVPLRGVLPIDRIAPGPTDFSAGPGPATVRLPGLPPFSPLICYESVFPRAVVDPADRPDWILVATNDAWFGTSAGPHQHFAAARLRAIEEGLPVVRVANGGISAVIDGRGHVRAALQIGRAHV